MADNIIKVNVTATKKQSVNITAGQVQNQITATPDSSQYYSILSRNWAIGEGLIQNEDYSSKHYANESKQSAQIAENFESSTRENYNQFLESSATAYNELQTTKEEALTALDNARIDAIDSVNTVKSESIASVEAKGNEANALVNTGIANINNTVADGLTEINSTKTTILSDIEFVADGEKKEIEELAEIAKDNIESTGFYMRDDKLYFINSKGEEEEFKSGDINDKITNCLPEVPQNIKLELNNGVLTLKAGSKVIVPNGVGVFEEVEITSDKELTELWGTPNDKMQLFLEVSSGKLSRLSLARIVSGDTDSYTGTYSHIWYNTTTNKVNFINNDGSLGRQLSLPIAKFTALGKENDVDTSKATSIDQVFNGFGYIGGRVWIDKGVKCLIPNGRNTDGTLKNIEVVTDKVQTVRCQYTDGLDLGIKADGTFVANTFNSNQGTYFVDMLAEKPAVSGSYSWCFSSQDNRWYRNHGTATWQEFPITYIGRGFCDSNLKITSTQFKQPFRAVDWNEYKNNPHIVETYVNGASGYRIWSDGYCEQWGNVSCNTGGNVNLTITLPRAFIDTNYNIQATPNQNSWKNEWGFGWYDKTTTTFGLFGRYILSGNFSWRACGYVYDFN